MRYYCPTVLPDVPCGTTAPACDFSFLSENFPGAVLPSCTSGTTARRYYRLLNRYYRLSASVKTENWGEAPLSASFIPCLHSSPAPPPEQDDAGGSPSVPPSPGSTPDSASLRAPLSSPQSWTPVLPPSSSSYLFSPLNLG